MKKTSEKIFISILVSLLSLSTVSYANDNVDKYSKSSILIDQDTNRVLYQKEADTKRPLASLSKMMTFLIAIEAIDNKEVSAEDIIEIDKHIASIRGSSYKLKEGEKIPLKELMKGLMIVSGNDAAVAISKHISKDEDEFVKRMNQKSKEIGMFSTNFVNPHGLPIYDLDNPQKPPKENISTARDISLLAKYMLDNYEKEVIAITDMQTYSYPQRGFEKNNTNPLLSIIPEVDGIKTGYTGNAGYCLSFSMKTNKDKENDKENRFIGVVLGTNHKQKRLETSLALLKYGKNNFNTKKLISKDTLIGKKYIKGLDELEIILKTQDDFYAVVGKDEEIYVQTTFKEIKYPIQKGEVLGVLKYYTKSGEILGTTEIISANDITETSIKTKIKMIFSD